MIFCGGGPPWFIALDAAMQSVFFVTTLLISWYSYRVYGYLGTARFRRWALGFLLLSLAYAISAATSAMVYLNLGDCSRGFLDLARLGLSYNVGSFLHTALFLLGYLLLALVSLRVDDNRVGGMLAVLLVLLAVASLETPRVLEVAAILLLGAIVAATNWRRHGVSQALATGGFAAILLGQVAYLFLGLVGSPYIAGSILEFIGYGLLAASIAVIFTRK